MKTLKLLMICALFSTALAFAEEASVFTIEQTDSPELGVAVGQEWQSYEVTVPKTADPEATTHVYDESRGGYRVVLDFSNFGFDYTTAGGARGKLLFVPLQLQLDASGAEGVNFGRVRGLEGDRTAVRKLVGTLVELVHDSKDGRYFVRTKLASANYDRDLGVWEWKILDAETGVRGVVDLGESKYGARKLTLELSGGADLGFVSLTGFSELERALEIAPVSATTPTISPYVTGKLKIENRTTALALGITARERLDLGAKDARYLGREIDLTSQQRTYWTDLSAKIGPRNSRADLRVFGNASLQQDSLTLSRALFGANDRMETLLVTGGLRLRM